MKKIILIVIIALGICSMSLAENLNLSGNVGGYEIEMIIEISDYETGEFSGRYRYLSQEDFLEISGTNHTTLLHIEEFYNGTSSGYFYLEIDGDNLTGWWTNTNKAYPVELKVVDGNRDHLTTKSPKEFADECNSEITGTYEVNNYYIHDYWVDQGQPWAYQLGYSGGSIVFEDVGEGKLWFQLEFLCGPTFHIASAEGIAMKDGDVYKYSEMLWGEDACEIIFEFSEKGVSAIANGNYTCGFGARAYVDHELIKISDEVTELDK